MLGSRKTETRYIVFTGWPLLMSKLRLIMTRFFPQKKRRLVSPLFLLFLLSCSTAHTGQISGWVGHISDSDSITVLQNGQSFKIRLYGIDCPESSQAYGQEAKGYTVSMAFGKTVEVDILGVDEYGESVGIVQVNGISLNASLLKNGYAWYNKSCEQSFCGEWKQLEMAASVRRLGLWADKNPISPWDWRDRQGEGLPVQQVSAAGFAGRSLRGNDKRQVFRVDRGKRFSGGGVTPEVRGAVYSADTVASKVVVPSEKVMATSDMEKSEHDRFFQNLALNSNRTPVGEREAVGALMGSNYERKVGAVGVDGFAPTPLPSPIFTAENPHGKVTNMTRQWGAKFTRRRVLPGEVMSSNVTTAMKGQQPENNTTWDAVFYGGENMDTPSREDQACDRSTGRFEITPRKQGRAERVLRETYAIGNLDVEFDPETDIAAKERFLAAPVRPTAQIDRIAQRRRQSESSKGQIASTKPSKLLEKYPENDLATAKFSPGNDAAGASRIQRAAVNAQVFANRKALPVAKRKEEDPAAPNQIGRFLTEDDLANAAGENAITTKVGGLDAHDLQPAHQFRLE